MHLQGAKNDVTTPKYSVEQLNKVNEHNNHLKYLMFGGLIFKIYSQ